MGVNLYFLLIENQTNFSEIMIRKNKNLMIEPILQLLIVTKPCLSFTRRWYMAHMLTYRWASCSVGSFAREWD